MTHIKRINGKNNKDTLYIFLLIECVSISQDGIEVAVSFLFFVPFKQGHWSAFVCLERAFPF